MNHVTGYARPVPSGFWAMLRFDRDGKPKPVLGTGGAPIIYETETEALRAVVTHLCAYFSSEILRDGAKAERFAAADGLFNLRPIRKNGKVIEVERRRAGA
ncbi:hypothetical protein GOD68_18160 [Sinorhizobium medicae]|nr:hypothetical protein [Sinorhizobium medicae]